MAMQDSTAREGAQRPQVDHDPAASGLPPIPIPESADVPEVIRERHDQADLSDRPELERTMQRIREFGDSEYARGGLDALRVAHRALTNPHVTRTELEATLEALILGVDMVGGVLEQLQWLGDRHNRPEPGGAGEPGEQS